MNNILHYPAARHDHPPYGVSTCFEGPPPPVGARFTIEGWNAVDPKTKQALPHLQVFVMGDNGTFAPERA